MRSSRNSLLPALNKLSVYMKDEAGTNIQFPFDHIFRLYCWAGWVPVRHWRCHGRDWGKVPSDVLCRSGRWTLVIGFLSAYFM